MWIYRNCQHLGPFWQTILMLQMKIDILLFIRQYRMGKQKLSKSSLLWQTILNSMFCINNFFDFSCIFLIFNIYIQYQLCMNEVWNRNKIKKLQNKINYKWIICLHFYNLYLLIALLHFWSCPLLLSREDPV